MNITISNPVTVDILQAFSHKVDLPIETVIEVLLMTANQNYDQVIAFGQQLSTELKAEVTE